MLAQPPARLEAARYDSVYGGPPGSLCGSFLIQGPCGEALKIISSDGTVGDAATLGWEHVSISTKRRTPNWREMCFVKALFWHPEECAVQYHPPESQYVNNHEFCLHIFRHKSIEFPRPPSIMVGVKDGNPVVLAKAWRDGFR